jgi:hypothetical protein
VAPFSFSPYAFPYGPQEKPTKFFRTVLRKPTNFLARKFSPAKFLSYKIFRSRYLRKLPALEVFIFSYSPLDGTVIFFPGKIRIWTDIFPGRFFLPCYFYCPPPPCVLSTPHYCLCLSTRKENPHCWQRNVKENHSGRTLFVLEGGLIDTFLSPLQSFRIVAKMPRGLMQPFHIPSPIRRGEG